MSWPVTGTLMVEPTESESKVSLLSCFTSMLPLLFCPGGGLCWSPWQHFVWRVDLSPAGFVTQLLQFE